MSDSAGMVVYPGTSAIYMNGNSFYGGGLSYNRIYLRTKDNFLYGGNTIDSLFIKTGSTVEVQAGKTTTLNYLSATGKCDSMIYIFSSSTTINTIFSKPSGTITVNYIRLKNTTAQGGATFNALNAVDNGGNVGWNITPVGNRTFYWVGGTGNWSQTSHWSFASSGASAGCLPAESDDVIFDNNSGSGSYTITISSDAFCRTMDWSTAAGTPTITGIGTLTICGSMILRNSLNYNHTGNILFKPLSGSYTINTFGKTLSCNIYFDGNGVWTLQNNFITRTATPNPRSIYYNKGTLNTNGHTLTTYAFYSFTTYTRILNLGASTINIYSEWDIDDSTHMTINPGTSTLIMHNYSTFNSRGLTYNNVTFNLAGNISIYGGGTFNTLSLANSKGLVLEGGKSYTLSLLTIPNGTGCRSFYPVKSLEAGIPATIIDAAGTANYDYLLIIDVKKTGAAVYNATNTQTIGDVSGWTVTPYIGRRLYWVGGTGNWSDTLHWSTTSGGTVYGCLPTLYDTVLFDNNSFSDRDTVILNTTGYCKNMNWTGALFVPVFECYGWLNINGSLRWIKLMEVNGSPYINFVSGAADNSVYTQGKKLYYVNFSGSGEYILQDSIYTEYLYHTQGTFRTNNQLVNANSYFNITSASVRTLDLGSSTVLTKSWDVDNTANLTFNAGTSEIQVIQNGNNFIGGGLNYNKVKLYPPAFSDLIVSGSNVFNELTIQPGTKVAFDTVATQTVTTFVASGTSSAPITLGSISAGTQGSINKLGSVFCGDYLYVQDINALGMVMYGCSNSINKSNNTGWIFLSPSVNLGNDTAVCSPATVTLDAGPAMAYIWSTGATTRTIVVNSTATYSVTVSNQCCIASDSCLVTVNICPGLSEIASQPEITVYPNPSRGIVEVQYVSDDAATAQVEIIDITGKRIAVEQKKFLTAGRHTIELTIPVKGVFVVRLTTGDKVIMGKVVVE